MARSLNSPAGEPVRRYLLFLARRTGIRPEKIPAERELAGLLGVARGTVREAIAFLVQQNYLLRIPGRKGTFTNPLMADAISISVGVLSRANWFDRQRQQILRGFFDVLFENRINYSCHLEFCSGLPDSRFMKTIRCSGHSLLLDLREYSGEAEMIRSTGIPVVDFRSDLLYDEVHAGQLVADFFLKRGCRKVVYWCPDHQRFSHFQEHMLKNHAKCLAETREQIGKAEQFLSRRLLKTVDGMFLGLNSCNISNMLEHLSAEKARFPILLPPSPAQEKRVKEYPDLDIHLMDLIFYDNANLQIGRQLGSHALELLRDPLAKPVCSPVRYYKLQDQFLPAPMPHRNRHACPPNPKKIGEYRDPVMS